MSTNSVHADSATEAELQLAMQRTIDILIALHGKGLRYATIGIDKRSGRAYLAGASIDQVGP